MSIEKICWIPAGKLAGSIDTVTDWSTAVASPGSGHPPMGVIVRPV